MPEPGKRKPGTVSSGTGRKEAMTLLDEVIPLCNSGDVSSPLCEQCSQPFAQSELQNL
jgi:hypothetical protein